MSDPRRSLPSVDRLLRDPAIAAVGGSVARNVLVGAVREALDAARANGAAPAAWAADIRERIARRLTPSLHPVLNATGVVLHTNLGRAPLASAAVRAVVGVAGGYSTLEFDLADGTRGSRSEHCGPLLAELTGTEDALVVNNAAAALVLALNALAGGREVIISRGELIEIGGSFRIPDIMGKSGAILREVGTTNRTTRHDYAEAIGPHAGALLTVHRSNFEQRGFVSAPAPAELAELAHAHGLPYLHDVGSGLLTDLSPWGLTGEPAVRDMVRAGADLVLFSGDKLLGGPQAGCLVGTAGGIRRCRENPFARAARADKLTLAALEATLALYRDPEVARQEIPVLQMLTATPSDLARRAQAIAERLPAWCEARTEAGESAVGGGAFPGVALPTTLVSLHPGPDGATAMARRLRLGVPPLVPRIEGERVLLDPRTLPEGGEDEVAAAIAAAGDQ